MYRLSTELSFNVIKARLKENVSQLRCLCKIKCMNTSDKLSNFTAGHSYKMVLCSHTLLHKLTSVGKEAGRRRTLKRGTGVCTKRRNAIAEAVDRIALYCVLRTDCCCWLDWLSLLYRWFRLAPLNQGFFNVGFTFL